MDGFAFGVGLMGLGPSPVALSHRHRRGDRALLAAFLNPAVLPKMMNQVPAEHPVLWVTNLTPKYDWTEPVSPHAESDIA